MTTRLYTLRMQGFDRAKWFALEEDRDAMADQLERPKVRVSRETVDVPTDAVGLADFLNGI